jgi:CTP:molybdopterin cytidylyltransferase MocA
MGSPKALLMWDQNKSFLEKIILEYLNAGCNPVVCTVNKEVLPYCKIPGTLPNVKIIVNPHPEWGRMHSVRLGLQAVKNSPYCLLQNVDNPFITGNAIRRILESASPEAWISPEYQGKGGHPVLLPNTIIDQILQGHHADTTLSKALDSFPKKVVIMEDDCILMNINTPDDYKNQPRSD